MIAAADCLHVSTKDATPGGTVPAISPINRSEITPGPLGISETKPKAAAPWRIANRPSATLPMQQIFTRVCEVDATATYLSSGPTISVLNCVTRLRSSVFHREGDPERPCEA